MQREANVIDFEMTAADAGGVSARSALLTCLPGAFAFITYVAHQWQDVPRAIGYLFWPLLLIGVILGFVCVTRYRRIYRTRRRPWFVSLSSSAHVLVPLVGVPFLLLLIVGALTGNLR